MQKVAFWFTVIIACLCDILYISFISTSEAKSPTVVVNSCSGKSTVRSSPSHYSVKKIANARLSISCPTRQVKAGDVVMFKVDSSIPFRSIDVKSTSFPRRNYRNITILFYHGGNLEVTHSTTCSNTSIIKRVFHESRRGYHKVTIHVTNKSVTTAADVDLLSRSVKLIFSTSPSAITIEDRFLPSSTKRFAAYSPIVKTSYSKCVPLPTKRPSIGFLKKPDNVPDSALVERENVIILVSSGDRNSNTVDSFSKMLPSEIRHASKVKIRSDDPINTIVDIKKGVEYLEKKGVDVPKSVSSFVKAIQVVEDFSASPFGFDSGLCEILSNGKSIPNNTIAIDPGHGGASFGNRSESGLCEKDLTLSFAYALKKKLTSTGYRVILTRNGDYNISPQKRLMIIKPYKPLFVLSVYAGCSGNVSSYGSSIYTISDSPIISKHLSRSASIHGNNHNNINSYIDVIKSAIKSTSKKITGNASKVLADSLLMEFNKSGIIIASKLPQEDDLEFLKLIDSPAILIELGSLTNLNDVQLLSDKAYMNNLIEAVARGIDIARRRKCTRVSSTVSNAIHYTVE